MAFLKKRGDILYVYWTQDGKKRGRSLRTSIKQVANEYLKGFEYRLTKKRLGQQTDIDIQRLRDEYLAYAQVTKTRSTYERHDRPRVKRFIRWLADAGVQTASEIAVRHVHDYQAHRCRQVSTATVRHDLFAASGLLRFAVDRGYVTDNVVKRVKKVKAERDPRRFLSEDELKEVFEVARKTPLWPLTATAYYAGLRNSELCFLEWSDLDPELGTLTVQSKDGFTLKNHQCRAIPLNRELAEILRPRVQPEGWCFLDSRGSQWNQRRLSWAFRYHVVRPSGIPEFSLHTLRHTFASHLVMKGVSIYRVSRWLGHQSVNTTMIYAHLAPQDDEINVL